MDRFLDRYAYGLGHQGVDTKSLGTNSGTWQPLLLHGIS